MSKPTLRQFVFNGLLLHELEKQQGISVSEVGDMTQVSRVVEADI